MLTWKYEVDKSIFQPTDENRQGDLYIIHTAPEGDLLHEQHPESLKCALSRSTAGQVISAHDIRRDSWVWQALVTWCHGHFSPAASTQLILQPELGIVLQNTWGELTQTVRVMLNNNERQTFQI